MTWRCSHLQGKGSIFISQSFWDPEYWSGPGNRTRDLPLCSQALYQLNWANTAAVEANPVFGLANWAAWYAYLACSELPVNRELKQQRRRRLRRRHLKSEFALLQTLSRLLHLVYFVKCWQMFLELNSKGLYQSSGKEKESCCLVFPSSTKREIRHFHVVVVQRRLKEMYGKEWCACRIVVLPI